MDYFEYVQVSRNFGKDSNISVLKLGRSETQTFKMGKHYQRSSRARLAASMREAQLASDLLGEILILFCEAERHSSKHHMRNYINVSTEDAPRAMTTRDIPQMRNKMHELALRRQKRSNFKQKTV